MICVTSVMQQDAIIELLENDHSTSIRFKLKEKKGPKLFFDILEGDKLEAADLAKKLIKAAPWGSILYFQSIAV